MAAEHLPDRETLARWVKDSDRKLRELTDRFDDAMQAISDMAETHYRERLAFDELNTDLLTALVEIRMILDKHAPDDALIMIDHVVTDYV